MINSLIREADGTDTPPSGYGIDLAGPVPDEEIGTVEVASIRRRKLA